MKYTILIYESESDFKARTDEGRKAAYSACRHHGAPAMLKSPAQLGRWLTRALAHSRSLPPKPVRRSRAK